MKVKQTHKTIRQIEDVHAFSSLQGDMRPCAVKQSSFTSLYLIAEIMLNDPALVSNKVFRIYLCTFTKHCKTDGVDTR